MLLRAGRIFIAAAFVFSFFAGALQAQRRVESKTITPRTPATPFERTMRPLLDRLRASRAHRSTSASSSVTSADSAVVPNPNFGGYLGGASYPARAANSIQFDSLNNGVQDEITADFDNDGHPDVAVIQADGTLNILHNNGSGVLSAPVGYLNPSPNVGGTYIGQAFATDLNGDGYLDIVAFDTNNNVLITWINAGGGTFNQGQLTTLSSSFGNVGGFAVGDVNGDGKSDVVVAYSTLLSPTSSTVTIQTLVSKGDGTFTAQSGQTFPIAAYVAFPFSAPIALGDLNGDGKLDIAAVFIEQTSRSTGSFVVTTALGNGDGTFAALGTNSVITNSLTGFPGITTSGVQIVDLNNDGKWDLVSDMNGQLYAALGQGNGSFGAQTSSTFASSYGTIFADLNGDGFPDAVTTGGGNLSVSLGKGDGTFAAPALNAQYIVDGPPNQGVVAADFDGDKKIDIANLGGDYKQVTIFSGNGDGTLHGARALTIPSDSLGYDTELATVVNTATNPYSDVVLVNFGGTTPALITGVSDGKGNFNFINSLAGGVPSDFNFVEPVQADINGDGNQDLLIAGLAGELWVSLAKGDGTFAAPVAINMPTLACPLSLGSVGDLNGDGKQDIVVAYPGDAPCGGTSYTSGYFVIAGNGDGTFQTPAFFSAGEQLYSATLSDMNSDGNLDLILNDLPPLGSGTPEVTLQLGNGNGTFGAASTVLSNYIVSDVKAADLNQDGKTDLLLAAEELDGEDVSTGGLILITGNGDGTFGPRSQIASGNFFFNTQVADVNGDSIPDIEATLYTTDGQPNTYYGFVTLLGLGNGSFGTPYNELESFVSTLPMVGNFFNDNAPDVVTDSFYGVGLFLGQGGTAISLSTSAPSVAFGGAETITAAVTASMSPRPAPTGSVSFYDGATLLGTGAVSGGTATFSTGSLAMGTHSITAVYSGDANFNVNTSAAATVAVTQLTPAFSLAEASSTLTLANGANGTVLLSLAANATFSGTINLTCSGAPTNASCGFDATSVTLAPGGTASATLVIGTTGTTAAAHVPASPWQRTTGMVSMAAMLALFWSRRRRQRLVGLLSVLVLSIATLGFVGCSGSSHSGSSTSTTPSVPSVGNSSFTISVTASASGSAAQTATVNVTVQ